MAKKISQIFLILAWPLKKIWRVIFKYLFIPIYNLLHLFKKKVKFNFSETPIGENKVVPLLTNRYVIYVLITILCLSILSNNFNIKTAAAEDLGKNSLLYKIAQGNEFEEAIKEVSIILEQQEQAEKSGSDNLARSAKADPDFLDPSAMALQRDEPTAHELTNDVLQESNVAEGLAVDTLQKTGSLTTTSLPKPRAEIQEYTVQGGDTISTIAEKFGISINTVLWANDLSDLSIIRPGEKLTILPITGVLHKIKSGDTLSAVAKKYDVEIDKILSYNRMVSDDQLQVNQVLIIPGGEIKYVVNHGTPSVSNIFKSPSNESRAGGFIWPTVSKHITQYYNWRHHAIDIGAKIGQPIYATMPGRVTTAGWGTGYGNYVVIDHGGGIKTLYGHMSKIYVTRGEQVTQGVAIGAIGSTGWSTGPHLHFEIIINGVKVNPLSYL